MGEMPTPSLSQLQTALNELNSMTPGSGKIHAFNTRRIGLEQAIRMYGKPGRADVIANEYAAAQRFIMSLRTTR
jgi:hypothetical protein